MRLDEEQDYMDEGKFPGSAAGGWFQEKEAQDFCV